MGQPTAGRPIEQCPPLGCRVRPRGMPSVGAPEAAWQVEPGGRAPLAQHAPGQPGAWQAPAGSGGLEISRPSGSAATRCSGA